MIRGIRFRFGRGYALPETSAGGALAVMVPSRSLKLVDDTKRPIGVYSGGAIVHAGLNQGIPRRNHCTLCICGFHAAGDAGSKSLLGFPQLALRQPDPLSGDYHLLLRGGQVE